MGEQYEREGKLPKHFGFCMEEEEYLQAVRQDGRMLYFISIAMKAEAKPIIKRVYTNRLSAILPLP